MHRILIVLMIVVMVALISDILWKILYPYEPDAVPKVIRITQQPNIGAYTIYGDKDSLYLYVNNYNESVQLGAVAWRPGVKGIDSLLNKEIKENQ